MIPHPSPARRAVAVRIEWQRLLGLDLKEIADQLEIDPPVSLEAELKELAAIKRRLRQ